MNKLHTRYIEQGELRSRYGKYYVDSASSTLTWLNNHMLRFKARSHLAVL